VPSRAWARAAKDLGSVKGLGKLHQRQGEGMLWKDLTNYIRMVGCLGLVSRASAHFRAVGCRCVRALHASLSQLSPCKPCIHCLRVCKPLHASCPPAQPMHIVVIICCTSPAHMSSSSVQSLCTHRRRLWVPARADVVVQSLHALSSPCTSSG
jgi:hypothetical protein